MRRLREHGHAVDDRLLAHVWPLGWEHINLTGDYSWTGAGPAAPDSLRRLRRLRLDHLPAPLQLAA
jgi:hypothetical protein